MPEQLHSPGAVFISYASQDAPAAERICEALRAAGIEVWLDKSELRGGDSWDAQIKKQIHDCALFIPVISARTNARTEGYFRREWKLATRRLLDMADDAALLVPVVIDDTREADARVPEEFLGVQWTRLPDGETPPAFVHRVRQLLGADSATANTAGMAAVAKIEPSVRVGHARLRKASPVKLVVLALITLLVLGAAAFWYSEGTSDAPSANPPLPATSTVAAVAPDDKSIAVLPFADMSAAKDQEYMSDGIAEELLNLLAQVPDLKVIARTSSFAFKGERIEIAEVAKKLNVAHVVEGSVRTSGNRLRVTAQLIRASDSMHLWSESYDRSLDDIFAVQDEIANAIVQALQIRLMGGKLTPREGGTRNLEAYQLGLRANTALYLSTRQSLDAAGKYAEQAIKLDPKYGWAWALLADIYAIKTSLSYLTPTEGYERARQLAQHALELSPNLVYAHATLQWVYQTFDWNWAAAAEEQQRALAIDPTNSVALNTAGRLSCILGSWDDSERQLRAARARDPLDPYVISNLAFTYYAAGEFAKSESTYRELLELDPSGAGWTRAYLGKTLLMQGKADAALAMLQQDADVSAQLAYLPIFLHAAGRPAEADEALKALVAGWADAGAFYVAQNYAYRGEYGHALEWLERAYTQKDNDLNEIIGEHLFKGMVDDPRYKAFLRKMNLPE